MTQSIKLGFAPTRRNIFSADAAIEYANLTRDKLDKMGVNYVDIKEVNDDGLLYDDAGMEKLPLSLTPKKLMACFSPMKTLGLNMNVPG